MITELPGAGPKFADVARQQGLFGKMKSAPTPAWTSAATTGGVVDLAYENRAPYAFTGTVKRVVIDVKPATHQDEKALHEHYSTETVADGVAG